jgi:hypothetical protein
MNMWILILTLVSQSSSTGQTIAAVNGFTSEQSCLAAANFWQQRVRVNGEFRVAIGVCAKA